MNRPSFRRGKEQEAYRRDREENLFLALPARTRPRLAHRPANVFPLLRVLSVPRVPGPLELAFDVREVAARELLVERALPAVLETRFVVLVGRAGLVVRAAAEVLPPVVSFRDLVQVLAGREAAGPGRLATVDTPARRGARCDLLEGVLAVAGRCHRFRLVGRGGVGAHSPAADVFAVVHPPAVLVDRVLRSRLLHVRTSTSIREQAAYPANIPGRADLSTTHSRDRLRARPDGSRRRRPPRAQTPGSAVG